MVGRVPTSRAGGAPGGKQGISSEVRALWGFSQLQEVMVSVLEALFEAGIGGGRPEELVGSSWGLRVEKFLSSALP